MPYGWEVIGFLKAQYRRLGTVHALWIWSLAVFVPERRNEYGTNGVCRRGMEPGGQVSDW